MIFLPHKGTGDPVRTKLLDWNWVIIGPFPNLLQFFDRPVVPLPPITLEINKENEIEQDKNTTSSAEVINHLMWMMQRGLTLSYKNLQWKPPSVFLCGWMLTCVAVRGSRLRLNDESQRQRVKETKWGSCSTDSDMEISNDMISLAVLEGEKKVAWSLETCKQPCCSWWDLAPGALWKRLSCWGLTCFCDRIGTLRWYLRHKMHKAEQKRLKKKSCLHNNRKVPNLFWTEWMSFRHIQQPNRTTAVEQWNRISAEKKTFD